MSYKIFKTTTTHPEGEWIECAGQPAQYVKDITMNGNNLKFGMNDGFEINYEPIFVTLDTAQTITGIKTLNNNLVLPDWHNDGSPGPVPIVSRHWTDNLYFGNVWFYAERPDIPAPSENNTQLKFCGNYFSFEQMGDVTGYINFPLLSDSTSGKTLALAENIADTYATKSTTYTKTECDNTFATQTALQQGLATREVAGACYTKTESDNKYVPKSTATTPTLTGIREGWTDLGHDITNIGGKFYYINFTVRNDSGVAQGAADYPIYTITGGVLDCALTTACFENLVNRIDCVVQTGLIKFRTNGAIIPAGAYIPITGVIRLA